MFPHTRNYSLPLICILPVFFPLYFAQLTKNMCFGNPEVNLNSDTVCTEQLYGTCKLMIPIHHSYLMCSWLQQNVCCPLVPWLGFPAMTLHMAWEIAREIESINKKKNHIAYLSPYPLHFVFGVGHLSMLRTCTIYLRSWFKQTHPLCLESAQTN